MAYHHSMQLLLVEDELEIQSFLKQSLTDAGYEVDAAKDGRAAAQLASGKKYDVLIVDLGLPDQDGIDLILQLRQSGVSSPVLILSARRSVDDRVKGLEQGGDDYLTNPFALAELLARLRNLLRRNLAASEEASRLRVLDLELDFIRRRASRGGEVLNLSPRSLCSWSTFVATPEELSLDPCFSPKYGECEFSRILTSSTCTSTGCAARWILKAASR